MKKFLIGMVLVMSSSVFAGTPDEDIIIKDLRNRFKAGKQPSTSYLLNNYFTCKEYLAVRDDFTINDLGELTFEKEDSYFIATQESSTTDNAIFLQNGKELITSHRKDLRDVELDSRPFYKAFRVDKTGALISEFSAFMTHGELAPISKSVGRVVSYCLCKPKKLPTL
jgi:hypothetical protein